jgi:hypothetical protein
VITAPLRVTMAAVKRASSSRRPTSGHASTSRAYAEGRAAAAVPIGIQ